MQNPVRFPERSLHPEGKKHIFSSMKPKLFSYFLPLFPLAAGVAAVYKNSLPTPVFDLLPQSAGLLFLLTLGLAFFYGRSRILFALLPAPFLFFLPELLPPPGRQALLAGTAVLLPLGFLAAAFLEERGIFTIPGLKRLALFLAGYGGLFLAAWKWPLQLKAEAVGPLWPPLPFKLSALPPDPALAAFFLALAGFAFLSFRRRKGSFLEPAFFSGMLAFSLHLLFFPAPALLPLFVLATLAALLAALLADSYSLAYRDELTGVPGRRALMEAMKKLPGTYSIAMSDIDFFKKFNDTHGHDVGDQVLQMVAAKLAKVRGGGKAYRYGGEEFTILFPGKSPEEAFPFLEELRTAIENSPFYKRTGNKKARPKALSVTVSMGVAGRSKAAPEPEQVMKLADKALYKAKEGGRNRVEKG